MPRYRYMCKQCDNDFEVVHSIKERLEDCPSCGKENSLKRVPYILSKSSVIKKGKKVGESVKQHIEGTKKEVKREKERMKKVEIE